MSWNHLLSQRARSRGDAELAAILAGVPEGVLAATGGFPNPETFPAGVLDDIVARLVRDEPAVALQYAPSAGLPSFRAYLRDRVEALDGVRPGDDELTVTSGGMECLDLVCKTLLDPGDVVAVEAPTYLGAIMSFRANEAEVEGVPMDDDGLVVDALADRLARPGRPKPKFLYVIPDHQNPSGRTLSLERRHALIDTCRRHGVLILEDVAYREITFDPAGPSLPSLWSLEPSLVVQAGTFSKVFSPGVRLGWAVGPAEIVTRLADAKQNTDQCAAALGQRMVEEYGRAGHFDRELPRARALYASRWDAVRTALERELGDNGDVRWSQPSGGFFTWLTLHEDVDTRAMRGDALAAGVAYVAGSPFFADDATGPRAGANELRFSFSHLSEADLDEAVRRLARVILAR